MTRRMGRIRANAKANLVSTPEEESRHNGGLFFFSKKNQIPPLRRNGTIRYNTHSLTPKRVNNETNHMN